MNKTILAFGVLILFILKFIDRDAKSIQTINKTMLIPPKTSIFCGYVTDGITNEPMEDVYCIFSYSYNGTMYSIWTDTDSNGFYSSDVPATDQWWLEFRTNYYYSYYSAGMNLGENETIWKNVSLYPIPPENSVVCGYIKDLWTQKPIWGAEIAIHWRGDNGSDWYENMTDEYGFFSKNIPAGEFTLYVYRKGYWILEIFYYIEENETLWVNHSLLKSRSKIASYYLYNFLERFPLLNLLLQRLRI